MTPLWADLLGDFQLPLLGMGIMLLGWVMWRTAQMPRKRAQQSLSARQNEWSDGPAEILQDMEVRLYDFGREVEARVGNRLVLLEQLMQELQVEQQKLRDTLAEARQLRDELKQRLRAA